MIFTLYKKEIKTYFSSPMAYVMTGFFSLICGWIFFNSIARYILQLNNAGPVGAQDIQFGPVVFQIFGNMNMIFLLFIPIITMRLLAEEKKLKTIELLYSAPLSDWQIIISKYLSGVSVVLFMLSSTLMFPIVLYFSGLNDFSFFIAGYLATILNIAIYVAIGVMASSMTENQMISIILAVVISFGLWLITWASHITQNFFLVEFFRYIGLSVHFDMIRNGILELYHLGYYFCGIFLCLFVTRKVLDSRNW